VSGWTPRRTRWLMAVWAAVFLVYGAILLVQGDGIGWVVVIGALVMLAGIVLTARDGGRHRR
jgi:hypothetical protein